MSEIIKAQVVAFNTLKSVYAIKDINRVWELADDGCYFYNGLGYTAKHIYFITNEPIVIGDYICKIGEYVRVATQDEIDYITIDKNYFRKVIASTNKSLGLPLIPHEWVSDVFIKLNGTIISVELLNDHNPNVVSIVHWSDGKVMDEIVLGDAKPCLLSEAGVPPSKNYSMYNISDIITADEARELTEGGLKEKEAKETRKVMSDVMGSIKNAAKSGYSYCYYASTMPKQIQADLKEMGFRLEYSIFEEIINSENKPAFRIIW